MMRARKYIKTLEKGTLKRNPHWTWKIRFTRKIFRIIQEKKRSRPRYRVRNRKTPLLRRVRIEVPSQQLTILIRIFSIKLHLTRYLDRTFYRWHARQRTVRVIRYNLKIGPLRYNRSSFTRTKHHTKEQILISHRRMKQTTTRYLTLQKKWSSPVLRYRTSRRKNPLTRLRRFVLNNRTFTRVFLPTLRWNTRKVTSLNHLSPLFIGKKNQVVRLLSLVRRKEPVPLLLISLKDRNITLHRHFLVIGKRRTRSITTRHGASFGKSCPVTPIPPLLITL